jgi:polyphosphate glucokinase
LSSAVLAEANKLVQMRNQGEAAGTIAATTRRVLVIDVGGTKVKALATDQWEWRKFASGRGLTPRAMVERIKAITEDWAYDTVTLGYLGAVVFGRIVEEPLHLARGWIRFGFRAAFGRPVAVLNDAALPALGSYKGGRMLFVGLGTGVGSAMIVDGTIADAKVGQLPFKRGRDYGSCLDRKALRRLGRARWERNLQEAVPQLRAFFQVDDVVLVGGNVSEIEHVPESVRLADNDAAFRGGCLVWERGSMELHVQDTSSSSR